MVEQACKLPLLSLKLPGWGPAVAGLMKDAVGGVILALSGGVGFGAGARVCVRERNALQEERMS